jgi:hypothetical protein
MSSSSSDNDEIVSVLTIVAMEGATCARGRAYRKGSLGGKAENRERYFAEKTHQLEGTVGSCAAEAGD